jgi:hypothetical protein
MKTGDRRVEVNRKRQRGREVEKQRKAEDEVKVE